MVTKSQQVQSDQAQARTFQLGGSTLPGQQHYQGGGDRVLSRDGSHHFISPQRAATNTHSLSRWD